MNGIIVNGFIVKASLFCLAVGLAGAAAQAQISKPSESELNAAPAPFQDLVHGRSDKINTRARSGGPGGPPNTVLQVIPNPSRDPHDLRGYWSDGRPGPVGGGNAGGAAGGPKSDPRPGQLATSKIDGNRLCLVALGVNLEPMKVYQSADQLTFVYANELRARRIYFARRHRAHVQPTYNGDSIAHWEGDTLVVDTVAIKGMITLFNSDLELGVHDALMASPTLHVIERITKSADGEQLRVATEWLDPASAKSGYSTVTTLDFVADAPSYDLECEDVGDRFGPDYGGGFGT